MNALFIHLRKSLLTALLGGASLVSLANGNGPLNGSNSANTAEVKYVTVNTGEGVFNVRYANTTGSRFSLAVLDAEGDRLYQKVFSEKDFNKNFKLADPESIQKLVFVIRNLNDNTTQRFEIEATSREEEVVEVKELK